MEHTTLKIGGMHCAGCVNSIQRHVSAIEGVFRMEVNLANEKAIIDNDPTKVGLPDIEKAVQDVGYRVVYETVSLKVGGITDSSDAQRLEQSIEGMQGVRSAPVNYGNMHVTAEYNSALLSP